METIELQQTLPEVFESLLFVVLYTGIGRIIRV